MSYIHTLRSTSVTQVNPQKDLLIMALAETVLRQVYKLGILPRLFKVLPRLSFILALSSIIWLLVLPLDGQFRNTYISENALMPGQVTSYFRESEWNYVRGFRSEVSQWDFSEASIENVVLKQWLQNFGWSTSEYYDAKTNHTTMYSLMHAPRGDNTEALVLVVPYFTAEGLPNYGGMSLGPALANYFARMSIWSKNIILVFPKNSHAVLRSWVEAYHTTLDATAGSIEAAIVIEYPSDVDSFSHIEISYEGLNGQLPNLDLINTVTTVCGHEGIKVSVQKTAKEDLDKEDYWQRLRVLAWGFLRLATAGLLEKSSPGCEAFSGWQIQAITLSAVGSDGPDITQFGRIVDSTFRSVNNLLEKFHQSFFFYLLLSPKHFVSIGTYLPAAVLMAVSFAISSLYSLASGINTSMFIAHISEILFLFTGIEVFCLIASLILQRVVVNAAEQMKTTETITMALMACTFVSSSGALNGRNLKLLNKRHSYMLLSFALYFIAMLITSMLIVHFALAYSIGLCTIPLSFIQPLINGANSDPSITFRNNVKIMICLIISSPVTAVVALGYLLDDGGIKGISELSYGLFVSWDSMQSWTYFVIALGWLPAWASVLIACVFGDFSLDEKKEKKN